MKTKIVERYKYEGLGFPIELHQVEFVKIEGEWHPKIDVKKIADSTIKALASQRERLTGDQIKFIRTYFSMPLREFAKTVVHESHTAVSKWEKCGAHATNMDINIEKIIRLYIHEKTSMKTDAEKKVFYKHYLEVQQSCLA